MWSTQVLKQVLVPQLPTPKPPPKACPQKCFSGALDEIPYELYYGLNNLEEDANIVFVWSQLFAEI